MGDNFYADFQPDSGDDDEEKRRLEAWSALAGSHDQAQGPMSRSNTVTLPEMDISTPDVASGPGTPPPPAAEPPTPEEEAPMSATAQLGQSLAQDRATPVTMASPQTPQPAYREPARPSESSGSGISPWALLADALLNRGRGVGSILALGAAEHDKEPMQAAELDLKRAQAEHLRNPQQDPAMALYKQQQLDLARQRIENASKNISGVQSRFDLHRGDVNDVNSEHNQTMVSIAGQKSGATTQSRLDTEHSLTDRTAEDKAALAAAETAARIGATHDLAPVTSGDAASQAEQVAAASQRGATPGKLAYESSMNPILADRQTNGVGQGLSVEGLVRDNPGLQFNDPEQIRRAMRTRTISSQTLDKLQASNRAREILGSMYKTIEDFQKGDKSPEAYYGASKQLDSHAQEYAGMMGRIAGSSTQEQVRSDAARVPSLLNPYALTGVKKLWEAADANIKGNLGTLGITAKPPDFTSGNGNGNGGGLGQPTDAQGTPGTKAIDTTNPTPSAGVAKGDYANYSQDTSDPRKFPTPTAPIPPSPTATRAQASGAKRMYVVTTPKGKTINEELTPEDADVVRNSRGWSIH